MCTRKRRDPTHEKLFRFCERRNGVASVYAWREYVLAGGLISYGTDLPESYREAAIYAGRILKGEKPADLPVKQPTKFRLAVNLKTAKSIELTV